MIASVQKAVSTLRGVGLQDLLGKFGVLHQSKRGRVLVTYMGLSAP